MSIEVGSIVSGKVTGITNFGAFIDLGERKTGLVHISEISDSYIKDINDVLTVGDEVKVKILSIADDGKIGLSIRKAEEKSEEVSRPQRDYKPTQRSSAPRKTSSFNQDRGDRPSQGKDNKKESFDNLMSTFLKESDDRLTSLKRNTEGKRGGRGGRRS
ncbi:S1 domain-containing RNA-binding protein [Jeotgalibaca ciconiae]|uniref:RNA-binding protein S1 n=1 Tax=Jeotgalibaca ciconiae TaxID=2496265 RepID=A0A3Q9BJJ3_9LACT|nr:S1 domain-containing RNA-binding protein [Jeotgalibaca ciconiae]AZP03838.1 RNA-binding protein S1 [Jeotgalibaca ciconiae]HJB24713.1 RNA-binding protein S1 [Candidatus Jeotgalibaca pullicola]